MPTYDDKQPVYLTYGSVRRLRALLDWWGDRKRPPGSGLGAAASWNPCIQRAAVTTAIPTGSLSSPSSSGKVKLRYKDASGAWQIGDEVACWNDNTLTASLPVGRACKVAWIAGDWWLVSASCS